MKSDISIWEGLRGGGEERLKREPPAGNLAKSLMSGTHSGWAGGKGRGGGACVGGGEREMQY